MEILPFSTVLLFLINKSAVEAEWTLYRRMETLDGNVCQGSDIAFSLQVVNDKTTCLFHCANHITCESIFYMQATEKCVGCKVRFDITPFSVGLASGSIFYMHAYCPENWFNIGTSCYFIPEDLMNFDDSVAKCESLGAHVVLIDDAVENENLKSKINSMAFTGVIGFFIGYTDIDVEGTWRVYGTSDPMTFQDWEQNEPNRGTDENCAALYVNFSLQWVDITCYQAMKTICEREM